MVSRTQVCGVRWLSRIDQEAFFGVRFLKEQKLGVSVWATRSSTKKVLVFKGFLDVKEQVIDFKGFLKLGSFLVEVLR